MSTPEKPAEEIEWTAEDDRIMDRVMAKLRAKGVKGDPVQKPDNATSKTEVISENLE